METLQSQVNKAAKKRLSLSGLEILHGRLVLTYDTKSHSLKTPHPVTPTGCPAMLLPSDVEIDELILQLASPLHPPEYDAFIAAAQAVVGSIPCVGVGSAYRALASLQARYVSYPPDPRIAAGPKHYRQTKLMLLPPVGADDGKALGKQRAAWARR